GNIIGFIPFGIYIRGVCKWKIITVTFVGFLFSAFIELMQFVLGTGITEIDDLILNTSGVFLGACISKMFRK
ncbi:MAG: VanZ family protein, partial [Lachnospiraceae bacterium]|nr:VanZ family protein [Lachnospiraceae bacterium]